MSDKYEISTDRCEQSENISELTCQICTNLFYLPIRCKNCDNHFCKICINDWTQKRPQNCPICKDFESHKASKIINTLLSKIKIKCVYEDNGCKEIIGYERLLKHEEVCKFRNISPNRRQSTKSKENKELKPELKELIRNNQFYKAEQKNIQKEEEEGNSILSKLSKKYSQQFQFKEPVQEEIIEEPKVEPKYDPVYDEFNPNNSSNLNNRSIQDLNDSFFNRNNKSAQDLNDSFFNKKSTFNQESKNNNNDMLVNNKQIKKANTINVEDGRPSHMSVQDDSLQYQVQSESRQSTEISCKVVLVGEAGVGKTCFLNRYIHNYFKNCVPTSGAGYSCKHMVITGKTVKFEVWDTAGQERYRSLTKVFYRDANCIFLMYDVTRQLSFDELTNYWIHQVINRKTQNNIIVIIGNKSDMHEYEEVDREVALEFAKKYDAELFFASAKQNKGVLEVFRYIGEQMIKKLGLESESEEEMDVQLVKLASSRKNSIKKGRCKC